MSVHDTLPTSLGKEETVSYTQLVSPNPVLLSARHDVKMSASVCTGNSHYKLALQKTLHPKSLTACVSVACKGRRMPRPQASQGNIRPHRGEHGAAEEPAESRPLGIPNGWMASLLNFSPFAFASADLEQEYQDYQTVSVGSHVGIACWLLGLLWVTLPISAWHKSVDYPRLWLFAPPMAICFGVGCFSRCAPGVFRRNWQACAFAIITMVMLMDDEVTACTVASQAATGKLQAEPCRALLGPIFRLFAFMLFAVGFPISVPAWGLAHAAMWVTADYGSACRRLCVQGVRCPSMGRLVSSALQIIMVAYPGEWAHVGSHALDSVIFCEVWVHFWMIQAEVMGAVVGAWRDVVWRRSFLRSHASLVGHDGAARAAAWPVGSPRAVVTCFALLLCLLYIEVMAMEFRVLAVLRTD